jgi:hypothetical protein
MVPIYFKAGNYAVGCNWKVASSSVVYAILQKFYPLNLESVRVIQGKPATDELKSQSRLHMVCPKIVPTPSTPVVVLFRDPVDKFLAACAETGVTAGEVDLAIQLQESQSRLKNIHFMEQHTFLTPNCTVFKFPDRLEEFCALVGLDYPLPVINTGSAAKPELAPEQEARVRQIYARDCEIFASL